MRPQKPNLTLLELLYRGNRIEGYNFTRSLFVMGYNYVYQQDLQKRVKLGSEVAPFLQLLYQVRDQ